MLRVGRTRQRIPENDMGVSRFKLSENGLRTTRRLQRIISGTLRLEQLGKELRTMKNLAAIIVFLGLLLVVACGGSEVPTERSPEAATQTQSQAERPPESESQQESQAQAQPDARDVATQQQPTDRTTAIPQQPTARETTTPQRPAPTEPTSTASTIEKPQEDPEPSLKVEDPESSVEVHGLRFYEAPPSLDMQIFAADIIVVATLVSVTAEVKAEGDLFLPVQSLRFRSSQYLKGTGHRVRGRGADC